MSGYYEDPMLTASVVDMEGFMRTYITARIDDNGYIVATQLIGV